MPKELLKLTDNQKSEIVRIAEILQGLPYIWGHKIDGKVKPEDVKKWNMAIDCSGLVKYIYSQLGISIRDGSVNQFETSQSVEVPEVGDFAFKWKNNQINHIALVIDKDRIVEAEGYYGKVLIRSLKDFKTTKPKASQFAGIRRLLVTKVSVS